MAMRLRTDFSVSFLRTFALRPIVAAGLLCTACSDDQASSNDDDDFPGGFASATAGGTAGTAGTAGPGPDGSDGNPSDPSASTSGPTTSAGTTGGVDTSDSMSGPDDDDDGPDDDGVGSDDGEPPPPGGTGESCDAGHEAWVKRLIPFAQGRRPESIREVRLLTAMIEQLEARGQDGRTIVARGLSRGDLYLERWRTWLYEELRVNLAGDRRNDECYNLAADGLGDSPDLAAFIRDNTADANFGQFFWMPDVVYSGLHLDDMTPIYRADLFARMSAPLIAGNVSAEELEEMRRASYGMGFEQVYFGRNTECLQCHRSEWAVTYDVDPLHNRHWAIPGHFELAVYGPNAAEAQASRHQAVFRYFNFATPYYDIVARGVPGNARPAFGMGPSCGAFRFGAPGPVQADLRTSAYLPYLISDFASYDGGYGATIFEFDTLLRQGFEDLRTDGLQIEGEGTVSGPEGAAYLFSMNFSNRLWIEAMGFPLTVANNFPRNEAQRDVLHGLTQTFVSEGYSLRALISTIATHAYFNQAAPAECDASTPYYMAAVFDPFTREASDPAARGNGVGDGVHRIGAWPLLDSLARSMWWNRPDTFGEDDFAVPGNINSENAQNLPNEVPEYNCGGSTPQYPCIAEPADAQILRDMGAFLSDSEAGFEGIDMVALLRLEREFGEGRDPGMAGACTGPLGENCASEDWIAQLIDVAMATPGALMWDVATAVKDRIITETTILEDSEQDVLEDLMGVSLTETVADVGAEDAEEAARRLAGMLFNTPQFMLAGISAPDQEPENDPRLVVPGTDTESLCNVLAPLILENEVDGYAFAFTCSDDGIELED